MASSQQQSKRSEPAQTNNENHGMFDQNTREKSSEALLSLLHHMKRQDDKSQQT